MRIKAEADLSNVCPYGLKESKCRHCPPQEAPCVKACPKGAIYEIAEGILAIDHELCDGCGKCVEACPYGAIEMVHGAAAKCDLCLKLYEEPQCVLAGLARIEYDERELERIWDVIGWAFFKDGEYKVEVPEIRLWEAEILKEVVDRYAQLRGEFSWEEILDGIQYERGEFDKSTVERILRWIKLSYEGFGPLDLLRDENIEEIAVVGLRKPIRVYIRGKGWLKTNLAFWKDEYFRNVVNRLAGSLGRRLTKKTPRVNAILPDGSRLHAVVPPISNVHSLTIRRFNVRPFTPWDLIERGTAKPEELAAIWWAIDQEMNVVIAGNTGSGKTTTLNAILAFVPPWERIVIVEETPEIRDFHEHSIRLVPDENTSMQELVYDTLRMRPDRIVVGEVRRPEEMRALFDTMLAGQGKGSFATMHGRTSEETIRRIRSMGIPEEDLDALDVLIVQRRRGSGKAEERRIVEILFRNDEPPKEEIDERASVLRKIREYDLRSYAEAVERWRERRG